MEKKPQLTQVKGINHLREILKDGCVHDFFIQLNFGVRSSKAMSLHHGRKKEFYVLNEIDGTEQMLTEKELMDENVTNIGKAITYGAFYLTDY